MFEESDVFLNDKILRAGLLDKAEATLLKKLETGDETCFERLGDVYRQQGKLIEAAGIYDSWVEKHQQSQKARYLANLFNQRLPSEKWSGEKFYPALFFLKENFLLQEVHDKLIRFTKESESKFNTSRVYTGTDAQRKAKISLGVRSSAQTGLAPELKKHFLDAIEEYLPAIHRHLSFEKYSIEEYTTSVVRHGNGDFFTGHTDHYEKNWITLVYYFCCPERTFEGGSTVFYDTDIKDKTYKQNCFTQLPFADNRLVAFPSNCYHGVLPIRCNDNRFECGRFSIVFFLKF